MWGEMGDGFTRKARTFLSSDGKESVEGERYRKYTEKEH